MVVTGLWPSGEVFGLEDRVERLSSALPRPHYRLQASRSSCRCRASLLIDKGPLVRVIVHLPSRLNALARDVNG